MTPLSPARTLAEALRRWDDDRLVQLFTARPDLVRPLPRDMTAVSSRAGTPSSIGAALDLLDTYELTTLRLLIALESRTTDSLIDTGVLPADAVIAALTRLESLALIWGREAQWHPVASVSEELRRTSRGDVVTTGPVPACPEVTTVDRDPAVVDRVAAGAAYDAVRLVTAILDGWADHPPAALRNGGLSLRDTKVLAERHHLAAPTLALLLDVALSAGLIAVGHLNTKEVWLPTKAYDAWLRRLVAERWAELVRAWVTSRRAPGMLQQRDDAGRQRHVLSDELTSGDAPVARELVLAQCAALDPGQGLAAADLVAVLAWKRPRHPSTRATSVQWARAEAALLGLTALDAMASHGRVFVVDGVEAAAQALSQLLPAPVDQVMIQADLTAVAPGPLVSEVAEGLALLADLESAGGASVYRFGAASIRRAFDHGWAAAEVHAFLASASATPVPQPLTYLVDDTAPTHGRVRVGYASCFVRSDDTALLAELAAHPASTELGLRLIAPTVLIADCDPEELMAMLRERGASPSLEDHTGVIVARSTTPRRAAGAGRIRHVPPTELDEKALIATVAAIRGGDAVAKERASRQALAHEPLDMLYLLRDAVESRDRVIVSALNSLGITEELLVIPHSVEGGRLTAYDVGAERSVTVPLHRVTSVGLLSSPS